MIAGGVVCLRLQNRDRTGAANIGTQFQRLIRGEGPIKPMTDEELEFHRLHACVECGGDETSRTGRRAGPTLRVYRLWRWGRGCFAGTGRQSAPAFRVGRTQLI